jgi:nicotinamide mononucleotide transporter
MDQVLGALAVMPGWEALAVVLAIAYLLLAAREHAACWVCAFVSTAIYTALFWNVSLLMESALNVYYMAMAVYGWRQWRHGGTDGGELAISTWRARRHLCVIGAVVLLAAVSGAALSAYTSASWPYLDSFTTWGAVVTTFMVTRKILEHWIYWFVLDAISIPLYLDRGLHLTAALFAVYLVLVVIGFLAWWRQYTAGRHAALPA